jgi:hypothetical protein
LFASGASRHQVQLAAPAGTSWQAGGFTASLKKTEHLFKLLFDL